MTVPAVTPAIAAAQLASLGLAVKPHAAGLKSRPANIASRSSINLVFVNRKTCFPAIPLGPLIDRQCFGNWSPTGHHTEIIKGKLASINTMTL
jgi:hypothetical protein